MYRKLCLLCFIVMCTICSRAQVKFDVPQNVVLVTKEDYKPYEKDIITAAKWLETVDLDQQTDKRKEVSRFVMMWVMGSPNVTVDLTEAVSKLYGKNTSLLTIYIASYSRYVLENPASFTKPAAVKAALTSMMKVYQKDIEIKKSKEMEKLIKQTDDGKLDEYIAANFK